LARLRSFHGRGRFRRLLDGATGGRRSLWQAGLVAVRHPQHGADGMVFVGPRRPRICREGVGRGHRSAPVAGDLSFMEALFIGQTYIDVTFLADHMPQGDEKSVASEYAVSFGGNAVTAAFCCAKLGVKPDLIATLADDWLGNMFLDMAKKYDINLHTRTVEKSSLSFIMPNNGKRAIVRCRDDHYLTPFPVLDLDGCRALHLDGHQPDAALAYAQRCRKAGILTSLDGGGVRTNTHELLTFIDVAMVAERFCQQMDKTPKAMLDYLKSR